HCEPGVWQRLHDLFVDFLAGVQRGTYCDVTLAALLRFLNRRVSEPNRRQGMPHLADVDLARRAHPHEIATPKVDAEVSFTARIKRSRAAEDQRERTHAGDKPFAQEINVLRRNQLQHRNAVYPACVYEPTENIPADD